MNRRDFITLLGFVPASVAFKPITSSQFWYLPDDLYVVHSDGPITAEWMAAEAMRIFVSNIEPTLIELHSSVGEEAALHQFGCDWLVLSRDMGISRKDFSERYVYPAAMRMAHTFNDLKPKKCYPLMLPNSIAQAARAHNKQAAIDIRYVRAYDIGEDRFVNRLDMLVA